MCARWRRNETVLPLAVTHHILWASQRIISIVAVVVITATWRVARRWPKSSRLVWPRWRNTFSRMRRWLWLAIRAFIFPIGSLWATWATSVVGSTLDLWSGGSPADRRAGSANRRIEQLRAHNYYFGRCADAEFDTLTFDGEHVNGNHTVEDNRLSSLAT